MEHMCARWMPDLHPDREWRERREALALYIRIVSPNGRIAVPVRSGRRGRAQGAADSQRERFAALLAAR
jgi:hypothetical protein